MSINNIGNNISSLRKQKGTTQDELARFVGVSAQAVSKWENGGVPDTELLPKIADFFEVSIDKLFGRTITEYTDIKKALSQKLINTDEKGRFKEAFEYCWDIECSLYGREFDDGSIAEYIKSLGEEQRHSSMRFDDGFTMMEIDSRLQYFLLVPECKNKQAAFFNGINYTELFADFSDNDIFNACVMLNQRENDKAFTPNLIMKKLNITKEKALKVIAVLKKYNMIRSTFIEIDDTTEEFFKFIATPSFTALLIFAKEIIESPCAWTCFSESRKKPYLI
ncbi:MAG: helix-turn-helix transcriptional regulator [Clostridia bacterium]|nr:helix-turn-helix transcriptional regulator [Clostridia bacterium]